MHGKDGIKAIQGFTPSQVALRAHGFLYKMIQQILHHHAQPFRILQSSVGIDGLHLGVGHALSGLHGIDIINPERQNIAVIDGINDRVRMQALAKSLFCSPDLGVWVDVGVISKNRCAGKAEDMVILESFHDRLAHAAKLRAMTFVKYQNDMLFVDIMVAVAGNK